MLAWLHTIVGTVLAALAIQTLLNLRSLPRLERMPSPSAWPRLAVLIPARNEAAGIAQCVRRWASQDYPEFEVVVYDDESTDDTAARAETAAGASPHVHVLRGVPLPAGWTGKAHGCQRLREATRADMLVFADADICPAPDTLRWTVAALAALRTDAISALPAHRSPSLAVRALVALQHWATLTFVPLWARRLRARPLFAVTNGQLLALRAAVHDAVGGFASVAASLGEDVALGRRLTSHGHTIALVDGARLLECNPYVRLREAWRANVRNLAVVFFDSAVLLLLAVAGLTLLYLVPVGVLVAGFARAAGPDIAWTWAPLAEVALALVPRALVDRRAQHPVGLALLHPLAVAVLVATAVESALRSRWRGGVEWRGRRYHLAPTPSLASRDTG